MHIENGKLVYGEESCTCMSGKVYCDKTCPSCKGTMRGKRGGVNGCKVCYMGKVVDTDKTKDCSRCEGTGMVKETRYSNVPAEVLFSIPFEVDSNKYKQTFNEAWLGVGLIYSVTDYGKSSYFTDQKLIDTLKSDKHIWVQALNIADKEDNLCKAIVIRRNSDGYSVKARF